MGRRKIEIQPITHERNRSVTFLKRKNGLFKKAYELGVLCSVDVAVIIFEERPGHHVKLYQYCSTDIHDIVQRHVRYDGEKDTRGPSDFSGNASTKLDDIGEGDDDDGDDDDNQDIVRSSKRRGDGKLKPDFGKSSGGLGDLGMGADLDYTLQPHRPLSIPPPPISMHQPHIQSSHHQLPPSSHQQTSGLPISSDRLSRSGGPLPPQHAPNKKPRLAPNVNVNTHAVSHSRSSSDDPNSGGGGGNSSMNGGGGYYPSPTSGQNSYQRHQPSQNAIPNQYNSFFPMSTPPPFGTFDYPQTSSSRGPGSPTSAQGGFSNSRYGQGRGIPHQMGRSHSNQTGGGGGGPSGGSGFTAFLDADEQSRSAQTPGFKFTGLDWPVHSQASNQGSTQQQGPNSATTSSSAGPEANSNWLDFLSGTSGSNDPTANANPSNAPREPHDMSWTRERHDIPPEIFGGGGSGGGGAGAAGSLDSSKRVRGSSGSGHGSGDETSRKLGVKMETGKDM